MLTPNSTCARLEEKLWCHPRGGGVGPTLEPPELPLTAPGTPKEQGSTDGIKLLITVINERGGSWAPWAGNPGAFQGSSCREWGGLGVQGALKQSWE